MGPQCKASVDLTISIVNDNNRELLRGCLRSIYEHAGKPSFEVYVVDNASSDNSAEMVRQEFPQVHLICNHVRRGFSANHNLVLRQGTGRYFLLLNDDTVVMSEALVDLVRFMDEHPEAGVVGCKLLNPDGMLQRTANRFPTLAFGLLEILSINHLWPNNPIHRHNIYSRWDRNSLREVDAVSGACLMVRREAMAQAGLLDENFFLYIEEVDWCYRIKKANWRVYYSPHAQVIHYGGQSTKKLNRDTLDSIYWESFLYFYKKHYGDLTYAAFRTLLQGRTRLSRWALRIRKRLELVNQQ